MNELFFFLLSLYIMNINPDLKLIYLGSLIDRYVRTFSDMIKEMEKINMCININENIININLKYEEISSELILIQEQLSMYK